MTQGIGCACHGVDEDIAVISDAEGIMSSFKGRSAGNALSRQDLVCSMTAVIVGNYVCGAAVPLEELPTILRSVHGMVEAHVDALGSAEDVVTQAARLPPAGLPAVSIEDSVTDDHIVCLEDGRKLKTLKRHLQSVYNLSPEEYRKRWNLPDDYPMVAPKYSRQRSAMARGAGLGRKTGTGQK